MSDSAFDDAFDEEPVAHNGPGFLTSHNVISSSDLNLHQLIDRSGTGLGRFNRQHSVTAADFVERHADTVLAEEKAKVATIEDSMQKCQSLTEAMMGLLATFERKLDSLESTMLPVHEKTHSLTTAQKNIDSTLTEIEVVLTYNQIAHERDEEIAARNVRSDPAKYIEWVARTNQALSFFQKNMSWKNSDRLIKRLRELNDKGVGEVRAEFARILKNHEKAVDLKATNWVFPRDFELIASEHVDKLSQLAACLEASGKTDFDRVLVTSRSTAFKTSLKYLVNVHDASTAAGGGAVGGDSDGDMAMQQLGRYKRGSHFTIFFTNYTSLLLELENALLGKILRQSTKLQPVDLYNFFVEIADPPIEYMCKKNEGVTRDKSPNKILILLDVLQHLKYMLPKFTQLLKRSTQPSQPLSRITNLRDSYISAIEKALKAYREYVTTYTPPKQSSSVKQLSREGTIFTLTIETLNFIKHLFEYREAVVDVGGSVSGVPGSHDDDTPVRPSSNPAQSRPVSSLDSARAEPASLVGKIIVSILIGLNQNLEAKAKTYKDPALAAIFLLNNFHYIAKQIRATFSYSFQYPLTEEKSDKAPASLLKEVGEGFVIKNYDQAVRKARSDYARCWDKAKQFLSVDEGREFVHAYNERNPLGAAEVRTSGNASVSDKEVPSNIRKMIKSKFAGFNTVFEELYNTQRVYSVPDSDFRSQLRNDNVEIIIPMYKHFLDQYAHIPFSTHPRDYHKYDVVTLEGMLNQFFDESYVTDS